MNPVPEISVVLCTYNPNPLYLRRVLESIDAQTLPHERWEFILVDSGSPKPVDAMRDLRWPTGTRFVRAPEPGLALARTVGFDASHAPIIAFIDDDTVLEPDYLANGLGFMGEHRDVGSVSGRLHPDFEVPPPSWISEFNVLLALRDFGDKPLFSTSGDTTTYPAFAPIGPNIFRREQYALFRADCERDPTHYLFGRKAGSLASGEDNDFVMGMLRRGVRVAYCPTMVLTHIMPARRLDPKYLGALNRASSQTWEQVQTLNGIATRPPIPQWTLPLRKARAWLRLRAWRGGPAWIKWQGACGHFEGRVKRSSGK